MLKTVNILGVKITSEKEDDILKYVIDNLKKPKSKREKIVIFTPNPEQIAAAQNTPELKSLLNKADIALPDGVGVVVGGKLVGQPIEARIAGVDFMQKLIVRSAKEGVKSGFFGGQIGVAEEAVNCLRKIEPDISIGYASNVYDKEKMIHSDIDILFVGLGFPKQEEWIIAHKDEVEASVIMAVGGSFDFLSGKIMRAPKVVQGMGLEWAFRLGRQPWRIFRQARLLYFGGLIFQEALTSRLKTRKK